MGWAAMGAGDATVSLAEVLRNSGALPEPLIAQLLRLLLPQLVDADASGQLGKNSVRLGADLCRVEPEAKAAGGERLWWSPERCAGGAASEADDVWGVGAMAAECALGIPPALGAAASGRGAVDPAHVAARLREGTWSAEFCDFVAACLTEDAARRPTLSALQGHQLLAKHAGVEIWAGEGSAQLRLSAAVAEAAVTYLYAVRTAPNRFRRPCWVRSRTLAHRGRSPLLCARRPCPRRTTRQFAACSPPTRSPS